MFHGQIAGLVTDLPTHFKPPVVAALVSALILARYLVVAGAGFFVAMIVSRLAPWRRLQNIPFTRAQVAREIGYSLLSVLVFAVIIGIIFAMHRGGLTQLYSNPGQYGWAWFCLQIPVVCLVHDGYFYHVHRIMHLAPFYDRVHRTHHLSINPSAFAAIAFHPLESILEIAIFVVLVVVMPLHITAIFVAGTLLLVFNVYGHLGFEIMPRFIARSRIGHWLNKSAYHSQHHRTCHYNYGLYTVIWDRLFGTLHPEAEELFDRATLKSRAASQQADVEVRIKTGQ